MAIRPSSVAQTHTDPAQTIVPLKEKTKMISLPIIYILISVVGGAAGQLMLKYGMNRTGAITLSADQAAGGIMRMASNPWVIAGLFLYGCGTIFWLAAISRVDLSFAYPFASLSYVIMLLVAWQIFDEQITPWRLVGTLIIATGVLVVSRG